MALASQYACKIVISSPLPKLKPTLENKIRYHHPQTKNRHFNLTSTAFHPSSVHIYRNVRTGTHYLPPYQDLISLCTRLTGRTASFDSTHFQLPQQWKSCRTHFKTLPTLGVNIPHSTVHSHLKINPLYSCCRVHEYCIRDYMSIIDIVKLRAMDFQTSYLKKCLKMEILC